MKRYIFSIMALLTMAQMMHAADSQAADTLFHTTNASQVVITESKNGVQFEVKGEDSDSTSFTYSQEYSANATIKSHQGVVKTVYKESPYRWDMSFGGLCLGFVSAPNSGVDIEPTKSFEISLLRLLAVKYSLPGSFNNFTFGLGWAWRNYRTTTGTRFIENDRIVTTGAYPENTTPRFSRIQTFTLQFPLMYEQYMPFKGINNSSASISFGAVGCWNTNASIKSAWTDKGNVKIEESAKKINHRKFTVDYIAVFKFMPGTGFYLRYSPSSVLTGAVSPKFSSLSFGVTFLL
jgi:hypothetical protein